MWEGSVELDKGGKKYWDDLWGNSVLPGGPEPSHRGLNNYVNYRFHQFFTSLFSNRETNGKRLLEIGCARSIWLPYFAKKFGFQICGIDYSEIGCHQARQLLSTKGVRGEIICRDFFSPPPSMVESFDVVISFGVLEHFDHTTDCLTVFSRYLRSGGLLITNIPNLCGLNGSIQKMVNRSIFDIHVALDAESLVAAHERLGLRVISCDYFLLVNFGVLNIENFNGSFYAAASQFRSWISKVIWIFEGAIPLLKPNPWSSPYINCIALKP